MNHSNPGQLLGDLRNVIAFKDIPDEHLQWIIDRSDYREFEDGAIIMKTGETVEWMWILLEGKITFYMDMNGTLVHFYNFENDTATGGVGGLIPYSRMKTSPGYAYSVGKTRGLTLNKKYFQELEKLSPELIQRLISYMTERARVFATRQLQHEKVNALGKLSAGIAHELNNPAAAINRISSELNKRLQMNYTLTENLVLHAADPALIKSMHELLDQKENDPVKKKKLTSMQRLEKEEEFTQWLEQNGFDQIRQASETFTEAGFSTDDFENIKKLADGGSFVALVAWAENLLCSRQLIKDLDNASGRISKLVGAIKSHVHMDRTNDVQPTNINDDIENTLTLLGYKIREKNITVDLKLGAGLPNIDAYVGELNQVWTNLIDNAIYAMERNGRLSIETCCDVKNITIKITDNGSGIPPEIVSRIFDPFFTTKKVGEGTGIGLDLVSRIIKRHNGEIKVCSVPGKTEFSVCIPKVQTASEKL